MRSSFIVGGNREEEATREGKSGLEPARVDAVTERAGALDDTNILAAEPRGTRGIYA